MRLVRHGLVGVACLALAAVAYAQSTAVAVPDNAPVQAAPQTTTITPVAATAQGDMVLLVLGLAISVPLVIFGSTLMIKLMERFPVIVTLGAALIGWVGGETIVNDNLLHDYAMGHPWLHYVAAIAGAVLVVMVGKLMQSRGEPRQA